MSEEGPEARARREAADWVVRLSQPAVPYADLTAFYAWKRDPANAEAYAHAEALWSRSAELAGDDAINDAVQDALDRRPRTRAIAFASSAMIGAVALVIALFFWINATATQTYVTKPGERRQIVLEDGSAVLLDTATRITVAYGSNERGIRLDHGRARFGVSHGDGREFRVDVAGIKVVATGTRFDVRDDGILSSATLFSGGVRLEGKSDTTRVLAPGETAIISRGKVSEVRRSLPQDSSWAGGSIVFDRTPLGQAIAEMNRYSQRPITLASPTLAGREITGVFDANDSEGFITAVRTMFDLRREATATGSIELRDADS